MKSYTTVEVTVLTLEEGINSLQSRYLVERQFAKIMEYIDKLLHNKQSYVHAWTNQYCHLGQRNTSRIEGAHCVMNDTLNHSNGKFYTVITHIRGDMTMEYKEVMREVEVERVRMSTTAGRLLIWYAVS